MRTDLKQRRKMSYLINIWDDMHKQYNENYNNVVQQVISFFENKSLLIYPAKSYFVAIIYAKCMQYYFNVNFYDALDDDELLIYDKYFVKYSLSKCIYDSILQKININTILDCESAQTTINYFKNEFLIADR